MPVGIDDVARAAGVSTATVSRALRGLPDVRDSTRRRVQQVAAELGYAPSPSAASLASGRTGTVGLLTPWVARWFHSNVLEGASAALRARGFHTLLCSFDVTEADAARPRVDLDVLRRRVDALLVVGLTMTAMEVEMIGSLGVPIVFAGSGPAEQVRVHVDDALAARIATEHLLDLGHRTIGHLGGYPGQPTPWASEVDRARGHAQALRAAGIEPDPVLAECGHFQRTAARTATAALLDRVEGLTAILADSDEMAFGVLDEARRRGLDVPGDLSVVGIDGHAAGDLIGLSTVFQDATRLGHVAAGLVLEMAASRAVDRDVVMPIELIARASTAPPRR